MWLMRMAAEVSSDRGLSDREIRAGEPVDIGDNGARISLDGTTIWAHPKSRFTVSQDGGMFEIQNGAFLFDSQEAAKPLAVAAGSGRTVLVKSALTVELGSRAVTWRVHAGKLTVRFASGDISLVSGIAVTELRSTGRIEQKEVSTVSLPLWAQQLAKEFENRAAQDHKH